MKKFFALVAFAFATLTASAAVDTQLELTGSNLQLPTVLITGEAEFQNFKAWGEVTFFPADQEADAYEIYPEDTPTLHLEFDEFAENLQLKVLNESGTDKYFGLDGAETVFDVDLTQWGFDVISRISLQSKTVQDNPIKIKKCVLVNEDGEEFPLCYKNLNASGWGVKVVGSAKCLSGKVFFVGNWGQVGGEAWAPADVLAGATYAKYTVTLNEPLEAVDIVDANGEPIKFQFVCDADRTTYHTIDPGTTVFELESAPEGYCPNTPEMISKARIQLGGSQAVFPEDKNECPYLNFKSVVLTVEKDLDGIKVVETYDLTDRIFNIAGQLVNENTKGIVIKNGKKYVVK